MKTPGIIVAIAAGFVGIIIWFAMIFSPGSYHDTADYKFDIPEEDLIERVQRLKKMDTTLNVPPTELYKEAIDGRPNGNDVYGFYVYFKDEKQLFCCLTWPVSDNTSEVGLLSVMNEYGLWRVFGRDLTSEEEEQLKVIFEKRIVNKLRSMDVN